MEKKKCDCMAYLAEYDYEGYVPVYFTDRVKDMVFWKQGDDQLYFKFCPFCGEKIDRPK